MTGHRILLVVACLALWACAGSSTGPSASPPATTAPSSAATGAPSSAAIVLHVTPADLGCDSIGIDYKTKTFHIDPAAAEPGSAMTDTGVSLVTHWPPGFTASDAVRDAAGNVVATEGEVLQGGQPLHGYYVCLAPTKLYVMLARPSG